MLCALLERKQNNFEEKYVQTAWSLGISNYVTLN